MNSIEIQQDPQSWILAVYDREEKGIAFLAKLPDPIRQRAKIHTFELEFPVYVIETFANGHNQFSFSDRAGLERMIRTQMNLRSKNDEEVYFTFYEFEETYFQEDMEKSQMGALGHTHVDNDYLDGITSL